MTDLRILHAADLHLDSPLRGLASDPDAPADAIRGASRAAMINLVDTALTEGVRLVVLAGDLYDGDWEDWSTGQFLGTQLARLTRAGIRVAIVKGNHDAQSVITRDLPLPEGVKVMDSKRAETWDLEDLGVAVHGRSFATRAVMEDISAGYPAPLPGRFNLGLLHTSVAGYAGHDTYAPCTVEGLVRHGYHYWGLGHVHARQILARAPEDGAWVVFPGNLQGRHIRETGPKGASLITVREGRVAALDPLTLDVVRWARPVVDLTGVESRDAVRERIKRALSDALDAADGRQLAVRLELEGRTDLHAALAGDREQVRQDAIAVAQQLTFERIWIERVRLRTETPRSAAVSAEGGDAVSRLVHDLDAILAEGGAAALLGEYPGAIADRLRGIDRTGHPLGDDAALNELLHAARDLVVARLNEGV